ncbi:MAG: hypothetical protein WCJ58_01935 [bacterium]
MQTLNKIYSSYLKNYLDKNPLFNRFGVKVFIIFNKKKKEKLILDTFEQLLKTFNFYSVHYLYCYYNNLTEIIRKDYNIKELIRAIKLMIEQKVDSIILSRKLENNTDQIRFSIGYHQNISGYDYVEIKIDEGFIINFTQNEHFINKFTNILENLQSQYFVISPAFLGSLQSSKAIQDLQINLQQQRLTLLLDYPFPNSNENYDYVFWINAFKLTDATVNTLSQIDNGLKFKTFEIDHQNNFVIIKTKQPIVKQIEINEFNYIKNIISSLYKNYVK